MSTVKVLLVHGLVAIAFLNFIEARKINIRNNCPYNIWIQSQNNDGSDPADGIVNLGQGASHDYNIIDAKWGGRFWPKTGCDDSGNNCETGQSIPPCGPNGCDPPAETKVEFHYSDSSSQDTSYYDISLVDGYSIPIKITPTSGIGGSCVETLCNVQLDSCPTNDNTVGDLRVIKNGRTVQCLAPCKKWNYPAPFGMGRPEQQPTGLDYCCPTPPVTVEQCRSGPVVQSQYVKLVHGQCPNAYSFAYDDKDGLHNCPTNTQFDVVVCP